MNIKGVLSILCICLITIGFAQVNPDATLFTIADEEVKASEFLRVYKKNLDLVKDESQKEIDNYFDLFVNYKLKIQEAKALGYDKKPKYLREFGNYRKQLAQNYLTDKEVTDDLIKEAYDRLGYDVNASHILVRIDAFDDDTSQVYNQLLAFKSEADKNGFDAAMKTARNGEAVIAEDLGYFSTFKMVYPFESAAYNTEAGETSMPFRTRFGYHIVHVRDKRQSRGSATVAHIMLKNNDSLSDTALETRINEIYNMLEQGQQFEDLAKQFSEDPSSSKQGGKLKTFKSGQLSSTIFEDNAFKLEKEGEVSKPFKSDYGWHIVKMIKKEPLQSFDEMKPSLENRIKRDSRSEVINDVFVTRLKKQYNIPEKIDLQYFVSMLSDDFYARTWKAPETFSNNDVLFNIGDKAVTKNDFAKTLELAQRKQREKKSFDVIVKSQFEDFVKTKLLKHHEENLEYTNPDFANVLSEYRDGLLLFDLMEEKVWKAVQQDSAALLSYYNKHSDKYTWSKRIDATIFTASEKTNAEKVKIALENGQDVGEIKASFNQDKNQPVIVSSGKYTNNHQSLPTNIDFKTGITDVLNYNNAFHVLKINQILPSTTKTFEESRGNVIADYQIIFEEEWLNTLKKKYPIKVNTEVLNSIKQATNN